MPKLGGSKMPRVPPAANDPAAKGRSYLRRMSWGSATPPIEAAAQTAHAQDFRHQHEQRHACEHEAVHASPTDKPQTVETWQPALQQQIESRRNGDRKWNRHSTR